MAACVAIGAAGCALPPLVSAASAQSVLVEAMAEESGAPLVGVFVSLLDDDGHVLARGLTNESGRFLLFAPRPGTFRVRGELIGRESRVSPPVAVRAGESGRVALSLPWHALPLAEIRVEVDGRCRLRPAEASAVARVWEEARKPMAVQAWAESAGAYRLEISTYERDLDAAGRRVEREQRRGIRVVTRVPFASLPPEELLGEGFVRRLDDGGYLYYGPDATVLLSDAFLDTHCFRLTRSGGRPGAIGLTFEPVGARGRPDIQGTFWLDEETAALRFIEYRYTNAPFAEAGGGAGGRVEFRALPDGAWMIERWSIRAPLLARDHTVARGGDSGIRVTGIRETGGEVIGVSTLDRRRISRVERGSVRGVVWDSTLSVPLAGASVYLSGTQYGARTDAGGRFVLDDVPAGTFTAGFTHPRLDSLGIAAPGAEAEVAAGRTAELTLAIPSLATIRLAACRAEEAAAAAAEPAGRPVASAVLSGVVRDRSSGEAIPGASVRVEWQEVEAVQPIVRSRNRWLEVRADEEGRYTACGVPVDEAVRVRAAFLTRRGEPVELAFAEPAHRAIDLEIGLPPGALADAATGASGDPARSGGAQGVQGRVLEHDSGRPIPTADISLRSGSGAILASGTTDKAGFFRLQVPRSGRFLFSARALGYADVGDEVVEIEAEKLSVLEVRMVPDAFELEPIVVTAERRSFHLEMQGFYRRRDEGLGVFMGPELLERRSPQKATDLFFGVPGVTVIETAMGAGGQSVYFRSGFRGDDICWPMVYVDHHLVSTGGLAAAGAEPRAIDDVVFVADILAMEVFRSPAEIPSEFHGPNAGCGVVVLWTRRGGGG